LQGSFRIDAPGGISAQTSGGSAGGGMSMTSWDRVSRYRLERNGVVGRYVAHEDYVKLLREHKGLVKDVYEMLEIPEVAQAIKERS
jgi:hypothetical protein